MKNIKGILKMKNSKDHLPRSPTKSFLRHIYSHLSWLRLYRLRRKCELCFTSYSNDSVNFSKVVISAIVTLGKKIGSRNIILSLARSTLTWIFPVSQVFGLSVSANETVEIKMYPFGPTEVAPGKIIGSLSMRAFETRTATGREHSVCQDSGVSHIFILIIHNREKVLSIINMMVWRRVIRENSSLPLAVRVSKSRACLFMINYKCKVFLQGRVSGY